MKQRLKRWAGKTLRSITSATTIPVEATDVVSFRRAHDLIGLLRTMTPEVIDQPLIRLGSEFDGGYLVPDDLDGIGAAISPGVAAEVGFDEQLAELGMDVIMLDASVSAPPKAHPRFTFLPLFLDTYSSDMTTTIEALVAPIPAETDLLLEMDIEGAEWRVIHSMSETTQRRFRIMIIEFHGLHDALLSNRIADFEAALRKLLTTHRVVHLHINNNAAPSVNLAGQSLPDLVELTLHRRDRSADHPGEIAALPHPLDRINVPGMPPFPIPDFWAGKVEPD